ncbi:phosphoglycerate mutase [Saccharomonospora sp. CUA-673]|uniref:histidine phosphatase family protein n=1 Tax=Saccharomonospora sp. CUA-673 TaxID=1904969 RepID=UPI0009627ABF|nr:histidine phosphatase family protein [Saccharomonospora sp. CUA-673]OLT48930.1 phosphoglycerate mutase [Saccharomonospora sp. CUA-673]
MGTVILLRHGRSTANGSGVLAGRMPGVELDDTGRRQARRLVERLSDVPLAALVCSPLLRCEQTLEPLRTARGLAPVTEPRLAEVDYGEWTGREIKSLVGEPLWPVVQQHPSAVVFPGGEGLAAMQARAVAAVRDHDARITAEHGEHAVWALCTHGDILKSLIADALGQHLDSFQRIMVEPASLSVVRYAETRPLVLRVNDNGGDLGGIVPPPPAESEQADPKTATSAGDAVVGGSTGREDHA